MELTLEQKYILGKKEDLLRSQQLERDEQQRFHEAERENLYRENKEIFDSLPVWRGYGH